MISMVCFLSLQKKWISWRYQQLTIRFDHLFDNQHLPVDAVVEEDDRVESLEDVEGVDRVDEDEDVGESDVGCVVERELE